MRRGAQPDGDGPRPRDVAGGMARGGIPPTRASSRHTRIRTLPVGSDDILARQLTRRDDPNRIEPIAVQ